MSTVPCSPLILSLSSLSLSLSSQMYYDEQPPPYATAVAPIPHLPPPPQAQQPTPPQQPPPPSQQHPSQAQSSSPSQLPVEKPLSKKAALVESESAGASGSGPSDPPIREDSFPPVEPSAPSEDSEI